MKPFSLSRMFLIETSCLLLIFLFAYTATSKMADNGRFYSSLISSVITRPVAGILRWLVPAAELIVTLLLLLPSRRKSGLLASFILLAIFTVYVGYMLLFIPHLPCSCGGIISAMNWPQHFFFNLFFSLLSGAAYLELSRPNFFIAIKPASACARRRAGDAENLYQE